MLERHDYQVKGEALLVLARTRQVGTVPCDAKRLLRHRNAQVRCGALEVLAAQRRTDQMHLLELMCTDRHASVRAVALRVLGELDPGGQLGRVHRAMPDEDPGVLVAALKSLDGQAVPNSLCDEGCRVLREVPGGARDVLLEWLLKAFPQQSTRILLCALQSQVQVVQDQAAGVLFGCGPEGP